VDETRCLAVELTSVETGARGRTMVSPTPNDAAAALPDQDRVARVVQALEEDIALARLLPRERLLEDELALRFAQGRHVIRQALADLETMGMVVRQRNRGASVRDLAPDEVENIYAVRELLERRAAELVPVPAPADLLGRLRALHEAHRRAGKAGDLGAVYRANVAFHEAFFGACGNPVLAEAIGLFAAKAHAVRSITIVAPDLLARAAAEHGAMIEALEAGDRKRLVRLVADHILPAKRAYLARHGHRATRSG
jgi:DNA-binding GntR family transcriptional regulator